MLMDFAVLSAMCRCWPIDSRKTADHKIREKLLTRTFASENEHGLAPAAAA